MILASCSRSTFRAAHCTLHDRRRFLHKNHLNRDNSQVDPLHLHSLLTVTNSVRCRKHHQLRVAHVQLTGYDRCHVTLCLCRGIGIVPIYSWYYDTMHAIYGNTVFFYPFPILMILSVSQEDQLVYS